MRSKCFFPPDPLPIEEVRKGVGEAGGKGLRSRPQGQVPFQGKSGES